MAIKSGRCHNCGSIIRFDEANEYAVCIFCNAKTDKQTAEDIEKNPKDYTFPNEPQEELNDHDRELAMTGYKSYNPAGLKKAQQASQAAQVRAQKSHKPSAAERVAALQTKPMEVPKLTTKQIGMLIGGIIVIISIVAALTVPQALDRNSKRQQLESALTSFVDIDSAMKKGHHSIKGGSNQTLELVSDNAVSAEQAKKIYDGYLAARAKVYGLPQGDPQTKVAVNVITPEKSFFVKNGEASEKAAIDPASTVPVKKDEKASETTAAPATTAAPSASTTAAAK